MKKVVIFILYTLLLVICADILTGIVSTFYVKTHNLPGRYQPLDRLIRKVEPDILFIGNSAIENSINPEIIEKTLHKTCYNGGISGQGILFLETMIDCALQRYKPKVIVLGFRAEELGRKMGDGIYDVLRPYYHIGFKSIDEHFNNTSPNERLLLNSNLYRFNTIWIRILLYSFFDNNNYSPNGFKENEIPNILPNKIINNNYDTVSEEKLKCLNRIIEKCQLENIKLSICFPPLCIDFVTQPLPCISAVEDICKKYDIPCYTDYNLKEFSDKPELFWDNIHLNKNGAKKYSQLMADRLAKIIDN